MMDRIKHGTNGSVSNLLVCQNHAVRQGTYEKYHPFVLG